MDIIRPATPEEIEAIATKSDLGPGTAVVSFGNDRAVIRQLTEIDPVFCESPRRKMMLMSHLETYLRLSGVPVYYFNIREGDEEFRDIVTKWGARPTSESPEIRYKKVL